MTNAQETFNLLVKKISAAELSTPLTLKSDTAAEFPLYLYYNPGKDYICYAHSLPALLQSPLVSKPLLVNSKAVSFLLQSGVLPLPETAYQNLFLLSVGDSAIASAVNGRIELSFSHYFPFLNAQRGREAFSESKLLQMLIEALSSRIDQRLPLYLSHSAGKDSNSILWALTEMGWQERTTFFSFKVDSIYDESEISRSIAERFGFKHKVLSLPQTIDTQKMSELHRYFSNVPIPCMDTAELIYPLTTEAFDGVSANIIDGGGNDAYLSWTPTSKEAFKAQYLAWLRIFSPLFNRIGNYWPRALLWTRSRAELPGLSGMSFEALQEIYTEAVDARPHWEAISKLPCYNDYYDLKTFILGYYVVQGTHLLKVRNFADVYGHNLILPWANAKLANYFSSIQEKELFDRKSKKNKLFLRKILKEKFGLDSEQIGKRGLTVDHIKILNALRQEAKHQILECKLWNKKTIDLCIDRLFKGMGAQSTGSYIMSTILYRLFILSSWANQSKYLQERA